MEITIIVLVLALIVSLGGPFLVEYISNKIDSWREKKKKYIILKYKCDASKLFKVMSDLRRIAIQLIYLRNSIVTHEKKIKGKDRFILEGLTSKLIEMKEIEDEVLELSKKINESIVLCEVNEKGEFIGS